MRCRIRKLEFIASGLLNFLKFPILSLKYLSIVFNKLTLSLETESSEELRNDNTTIRRSSIKHLPPPSWEVNIKNKDFIKPPNFLNEMFYFKIVNLCSSRWCKNWCEFEFWIEYYWQSKIDNGNDILHRRNDRATNRENRNQRTAGYGPLSNWKGFFKGISLHICLMSCKPGCNDLYLS